ncbi:MAG: site-specific tyrosine recombinase XerC [Microthrixaceae bacterium]
MPRRGERRGPRVIPGDQGDPLAFPAMVTEFCDHMGARGLSTATIEGRRAMVGFLSEWLQDRGVTRPAEVTKPMLDRYQRWLYHYRKADGQPLTFRSQHARLVAVRAFFKWATKANRILYNPASELELPRLERRLPKHVLTVSEAETVLSMPDVKSPGGLRDRAILEVFYSTGMRRAELARLQLFDVDFDRHTMVVRQGKGRRDRTVPVGDRALVWVQAYLDDVRGRWALEPDEGWVFLTHDGTHFSPSRLTQMARGYVKASGVGKEGACHLFRHTMATLMLEGGADVRHIQAMLGHVRLETTEIYTQVSIRHLLAIHQATHPGWHNERHRDPATAALLGDADLDDTEVASMDRHPTFANLPKVSSRELLAALDQESEQENRPHPGSPTGDGDGRRSRPTDTTSPEADPFEEKNP